MTIETQTVALFAFSSLSAFLLTQGFNGGLVG